MNTIKELYEKYKSIIPYLFFGVCTTIVNMAVYWIAAHPLRMKVVSSSILAWILAVLFAYFTNRKWVFHSTAKGRGEILQEITAFFGCRISTGIIDWLCMWLLVDLLGLNDLVIKFLSSVLVIILNYAASKLFIFRQNGTHEK